MKDIVEYFIEKQIRFKSLKQIDRSLLKTRKRVDIFAGTDLKGYYHSIFSVKQKSRFLLKNSLELVELEERLCSLKQHNFKHKHLIIGEEICSKSVSYFEERGWRLHHDFM